MFPVETLAIGTAFCIAASSLLATPASRHLGALAFTRWRMFILWILLAPFSFVLDLMSGLPSVTVTLLAASGLFGIVVGDTALYGAMARLGPRRTSVLFALGAPFTAVLAWLFLDDGLAAYELAGVALILCGVYSAVLSRPSAALVNLSKADYWYGVAFGLLAALGQAAGTHFAKPAIATGAHPLAATFLRVSFALLALGLLRLMPFAVMRPRAAMDRSTLSRAVLSACIGMGLGMTLQMTALSGGKPGIVASLSAMTPVAVLPLLWIFQGERPTLSAILGAILAAVGASLVFWRD
jgi:drug/metabolite transporter (DMT)-like permease